MAWRCVASYPAKCGSVSVVNCNGHMRPQQVHPFVTFHRSITCWRQQYKLCWDFAWVLQVKRSATQTHSVNLQTGSSSRSTAVSWQRDGAWCCGSSACIFTTDEFSCSDTAWLKWPHIFPISPLKPTGHYMYRQFNIQQFYLLPTQCIYVFCVDLRTNSDYFPIQH